MPFVQYRSEAYFGDQDMLHVIEAEEEAADMSKYFRESTAECIDDAEILIIKRRQIIDALNKFKTVKELMHGVANEKRKYHRILVNSILARYRDPTEAQELILQRMDDQIITTHMSLKQALKKNKERNKTLSQMPRARKGNVLDALGADLDSGIPIMGRSPRSLDVQDEEVVPEQQIKVYSEVPVIDIMKNKINAVLESYTLDMKKTIEEVLKPKAQETGSNGNNSPSNGKLDTQRSGQSSVFDAGEEKDIELKIADLLDESQTYYEKNMNAAANNMSLLALNSVEITAQAEFQAAERETTAKVAKNIEGHAKFMSEKSVVLRERLERAAVKFGYRVPQ